MSCIILTPTHIACDHFIVDEVFNHRGFVDTNQSKIVLSKDRQFYIGAYGDCDYKFMNEPDQFDIIKVMVDKLIESYRSVNVLAQYVFPDHNELNALMMAMFGIKTDVFIVTRDQRFIIRHHPTSKKFYAMLVDDRAAIGCGKYLAMGMLDADFTLEKIFAELNASYYVVSKEFSKFRIDELEPYVPMPDEQKKAWKDAE